MPGFANKSGNVEVATPVNHAIRQSGDPAAAILPRKVAKMHRSCGVAPDARGGLAAVRTPA